MERRHSVVQLAQLDAILRAIEEAERLLESEPATFEPVVRVIEVIQMQQQNDWVNKYLTPEQQQTMQELMFLKNMAVAGGMFIVAALGAGPVSIDNRSAAMNRRPALN